MRPVDIDQVTVPATPHLRIVLADDQPIFRDGLRSLLARVPGMVVVGEAADGAEACRVVGELCPDVLVTAFSMPRLDGVAVTARARRLCPDLQVVALTAHEDASHVRHFLDAGASAFVLKRTAAEVLVDAVAAAARGETFVDPAIRHVAAVVDAPVPRPEGAREPLSPRELEVLRLYCRGRGMKEIAAALGIGTRTAETYLTRLRQKLEARGRADLVRYAIEAGLLG